MVLYAFLFLMIGGSLWTWQNTKNIQARWTNVPPTPKASFASSIGLGDAQFAYRIYSLMLQNSGNTGGRFVALKDYNYERLGKWFFLQNMLDSRSDFIPLLAAYYFGASQDSSKIRPVIEYLGVAGNSAEKEKWRWLAQAVYLARFKLKDTDLALKLAYKLAAIDNPDMPIWARQMPANVLNQKGEKQAALEIITGILKASGDKIHPNEVNALLDYACDQILEGDSKKLDMCRERQ
ncbi:MAG: hypothetical protein ACRBCT_07265 [Alphaproteobacteria bacterium]